MGWWAGDYEGLQLIVCPTGAEADQVVAQSAESSIHIFSGTHWVPAIVSGLESVRHHQRRYGLLREPRASEGLLGAVRLVHSWLTERQFRRGADFVLAIGANGPSWFKRAGYRTERIFPFAYFVDAPRLSIDDARTTETVGYIGRLEPEKGFDAFLGAAHARVGGQHFLVAGVGTMKEQAKRAAEAGHIEYLGAIPISHVGEFYSRCDIVCAPSRTTNDGWCVAVSEALMSGCFVITTEATGASVCVKQDTGLGTVLRHPSAQKLAAAISTLSGRNISPEMSKWRSSWARSRLTAEAGAAYLYAILSSVYYRGMVPAPYWQAPPGTF